ncbi:hypothetical protein B0J17DRAFT_633433 [Rhizoctonia solani]|nr:hypothetical protein B0J17DRAFT_633433 [Rhizoctonia solani]
MSQPHIILDSNQVQLMLDKATELVRTNPLERSVALLGILFGGYTLSRLITPSNYSNIDGPQCKSFLFGHLYDLFSPHSVPFHDGLQDKYGSVAKVKGMFWKENFYTSDPRFMHEILVEGEGESSFLNMSFGPGILATYGTADPWCNAQGIYYWSMVVGANRCFHNSGRVGIFEAIAQRMKRSMTDNIKRSPGEDVDMLYGCSATVLEPIGEGGQEYSGSQSIGHTFSALEGEESSHSVAIKDFFLMSFT